VCVFCRRSSVGCFFELAKKDFWLRGGGGGGGHAKGDEGDRLKVLEINIRVSLLQIF